MSLKELNIEEIGAEKLAKISKGNIYISEYKGEKAFIVNDNYIVKGKYDKYADNPALFDNICMFNLYHHKYNLLDNGDIDIDFYDNINRQIKKYEKLGYWILPVYMYQHGGIALNTSCFVCQWDSSHIGWVSISKEIRKQNKITKKKEWYNIVNNVLNSYEQYLNGNIYEFETYDIGMYELVDRCCGFYADYMEEALQNYIVAYL